MRRALVIDELVDLDVGSWAGEVLGRTRLKVRSGHHQAVDTLGTGLRATGWALDGVVECIEHDRLDLTWAVGIQWHPEEIDGDADDATALFGAFVDVAREASPVMP